MRAQPIGCVARRWGRIASGTVCAAVVGVGLSVPLPAIAAADKIAIELDLSAAATAPSAATAAQVEKLATTPLICLDLSAVMDGKTENALTRAAEEDNPDLTIRTDVQCGPGKTGQLTMGPGLQYYLITQGAAGNRIDLSVFPGSRTEHIINDVACVFDETGSAVKFRARGLYRPITNRYQEIDASGGVTGKSILSIQLRPTVSTPQEAADCAP